MIDTHTHTTHSYGFTVCVALTTSQLVRAIREQQGLRPAGVAIGHFSSLLCPPWMERPVKLTITG